MKDGFYDVVLPPEPMHGQDVGAYLAYVSDLLDVREQWLIEGELGERVVPAVRMALAVIHAGEQISPTTRRAFVDYARALVRYQRHRTLAKQTYESDKDPRTHHVSKRWGKPTGNALAVKRLRALLDAVGPYLEQVAQGTAPEPSTWDEGTTWAFCNAMAKGDKDRAQRFYNWLRVFDDQRWIFMQCPEAAVARRDYPAGNRVILGARPARKTKRARNFIGWVHHAIRDQSTPRLYRLLYGDKKPTARSDAVMDKINQFMRVHSVPEWAMARMMVRHALALGFTGTYPRVKERYERRVRAWQLKVEQHRTGGPQAGPRPAQQLGVFTLRMEMLGWQGSERYALMYPEGAPMPLGSALQYDQNVDMMRYTGPNDGMVIAPAAGEPDVWPLPLIEERALRVVMATMSSATMEPYSESRARRFLTNPNWMQHIPAHLLDAHFAQYPLDKVFVQLPGEHVIDSFLWDAVKDDTPDE